MALKQIDYGTPEYDTMLRLRYDLLRKPLGLSFDPKELEKEKDDVLIGAFEDEKMLGCCLLTRMDSKTLRLRQMAVYNNLQGKGIGRALMIFAENIARDMGYEILMAVWLVLLRAGTKTRPGGLGPCGAPCSRCCAGPDPGSVSGRVRSRVSRRVRSRGRDWGHDGVEGSGRGSGLRSGSV